MSEIPLNDRHFLKTLSEEINKALTEIGEKHGLKIAAGSCRFAGDGRSCTYKLEVVQAALGSKTFADAQAAWTLYSKMLDTFAMKPEYLGRVFENKSTAYKVMGLSPSRSKFPIVCMRVMDGAPVFFPESVSRSLEKAGGLVKSLTSSQVDSQ